MYNAELLVQNSELWTLDYKAKAKDTFLGVREIIVVGWIFHCPDLKPRGSTMLHFAPTTFLIGFEQEAEDLLGVLLHCPALGRDMLVVVLSGPH